MFLFRKKKHRDERWVYATLQIWALICIYDWKLSKWRDSQCFCSVKHAYTVWLLLSLHHINGRRLLQMRLVFMASRFVNNHHSRLWCCGHCVAIGRACKWSWLLSNARWKEAAYGISGVVVVARNLFPLLQLMCSMGAFACEFFLNFAEFCWM